MTAQATDTGIIPEWTIGDRLRKARLLTGLNTREFADKIGVSHGTVNNAESGRRAVRTITVRAWSLATGVDLNWLATGIVAGPGDSGTRLTHWLRHDHDSQDRQPGTVTELGEERRRRRPERSSDPRHTRERGEYAAILTFRRPARDDVEAVS